MAGSGRRNGELFLGKPAGVINQAIFWKYSKKFALLYNVQGQMYTIGRQFECRKCHGEYLFCEGDGVSESSHCEISCGEEGQFWVKDLQGFTGRGTFINGERIQSRMELKFGDILSLGGPGPKIAVNANREGEGVYLDYARLENRDNAVDGCTVFLFLAVPEIADSVSQIESQSNNPNANLFGNCHPLRNCLVISKIFGYLPLSVVKTCRLVCSEWNDEATKILKNNAVAVFKYRNGYSTPKNRSRLFAFVQEMGQFFTEGRFRIKLPIYPGPNCECPQHCWCMGDNCATVDIRGNPGHKMLSDLKWFFDTDQGFRHPVTKLSLKGTIRCDSGRNLFLTVLQGGSLHLEDLELDMNLNFYDNPNSTEPKPFDISFPSLKKLSIDINSIRSCHISGCSCDDDFDDFECMERMKKWMTSMITAAPNLQCLKLAFGDFMCHAFDQFFLLRIVEEKGFENLNSLNLNTYNYSILESIMKLPNLMSLKLGVSLPDFEDDEGRDFAEWDGEEEMPPWTVLMRNVLEKSAKSLKHLDLTMPVFKEGRDRDAIQFPVFLNLKVFKLRKFYSDCISLYDSPELGFNFKDYFPMLETFCIYWADQNKVHLLKEKHFFDVFFPPIEVESDDEVETNFGTKFFGCPTATKKDDEEQVVNSVRHLEIQNLKKWNPIAVNRIDKLFPNAFNKQLEKFRQTKALTMLQ